MQLNKCQNMWSTLYLSDGFNSRNNPVETIWDEGLLMTGWYITITRNIEKCSGMSEMHQRILTILYYPS